MADIKRKIKLGEPCHICDGSSGDIVARTHNTGDTIEVLQSTIDACFAPPHPKQPNRTTVLFEYADNATGPTPAPKPTPAP